ncbi:unnamed protein product [Fraxinus pennsylvanica]|uniref:DUF7615 domain-containing protein n=1 Tax=Fraxinus pennsylvanica TaxID=56036 RepID=A0AAD2E2E9_9LAMI|nr:unnamed protein product [Fraxinus pennsylvanica]
MALAREIIGSSLTQKFAFLDPSNFLVNRKHDQFCFNPVPAQRKRFQVKRASKVPILVAAISEDLDLVKVVPDKAVKFKVRTVVTVKNKHKEDLKETIAKRWDALTDKIGRNVMLEFVITDIDPRLSLNGKCAFGFRNYKEPHDHKVGSPQPLSSTFDHRVESLKLEDEIDQILHALRTSQDFEYRLAEERLFAHKNYILNLYEQLDKERSDLSRHTSLKDPNTTVLDAVQSRIDQIKQEVSKLNDMEEAKKGFGRVSKYILKEHFGLEIES